MLTLDQISAMHRILSILVILLVISIAKAEDYKIPSFYITSNCIEDTSVEKSKNNDGWILTLYFSDKGAAKINQFSKDYQGKIVKFVFKNDNFEYKTITMLHDELTDQLQIEGIVSNKEVFKVQDTIPTIYGECGVKAS